MKNAFQALVWEQMWKNRMVFPVLLLLLLVGAGLTHMIVGGPPDAWWLRLAQQAMFTAFLASVLLSFAPFTLMESHHGWRMNSMVTRWFVLPVRTSLLVLIPFVAACLVVGLFMGGWLALFRRLAPELPIGHVLLSLLLGVAVMQTLAWMLPRRPSQFWPLLAIWLTALLFLTALPLDGESWEPQRRLLRQVIPFAIPGLGFVAYVAARLNRSGTWAGEVPWNGLWTWIARSLPGMPEVRRPATALFWSDVLPVLRTFLMTWLVFVAMVLGLQIFLFLTRSRTPEFGLGIVMHVAVIIMPPMGLFALALGGLILGGEPGGGFRTRLGPFRATRPVGAGTLAAQRVLSGIGMWALVWIPWVFLLNTHTHLHPQWASMDLPGIYAGSGRLMALSAHALVGSLPLFLWGRLEGFPNLLLAAMVSWAGTWAFASGLSPSDEGEMPWALLAIALTLKMVAGLLALGLTARSGHITWRYAAGALGGWLVAVSALTWLLPTWSQKGASGLATIAFFVPFARVALCPAALALNRHR